ncbi:PAS domain-containing sensor histidine kinase [Algimonas ampicilliniresistens]|uniref:histidine kinase n=1 Tax=Algimonas ampicilliniresistens TaxID=1298735 RepID=A0ABQ5VAM1_9PROT|nr:ATP-binding protein [Algimonas ampicilliniresistens]GLQ23631.1 PAS domain-containing sensor histidine kinase [Algimonas ampicilliniresistens]
MADALAIVEPARTSVRTPVFSRSLATAEPGRLPRIARSAAFGAFFVSAIVLTVLGALLSFSSDEAQLRTAFTILKANMALILAIAFFLGYRVRKTLFGPTRRDSAPLLHRRFVLIFSLAALFPAIIIGAFSASLISQNITGLFGSDVQENMESARGILSDYVDQELSELASDLALVRQTLDDRKFGVSDRISLSAELQIIARVRDLDAVVLLMDDGQVLAQALGPRAPAFEVPRPDLLHDVSASNAEFLSNDEKNYLIALIRLQADSDMLLYTGRRLRSSSEVLSNIRGIEDASLKIDTFTANQSRMNRIFALTFIETALLLLMAAIWLGLVLANRIIHPISSLVTAAERIRGGDMSARVTVSEEWGEISDLGSAFNRMTQQLNSQRDELVREHDVSEQRRQFSEAVLSGVRAGVLGLTESGRITLINASAERLLGLPAEAALDRPIADLLPEFGPAFARARESVTNSAEDQIAYETDVGSINLDVRVASYQGARRDTGWVVTFDDMTRLVAAQRQSAWREVARRIAHEIKNPLTPIQLSAERLSRKYGPVLTEDRDVFDNCTQTIIRQVGSLERMVDAFSAFAQMPQPEFEAVDLTDILSDVLFEQGVAFPGIQFTRTGSWALQQPVRGDERLLTQALTNIYKNAAEAVLREADHREDSWSGQIETSIRQTAERVEIIVRDNGPGWPMNDIDRLLEPYVTTREGGTGLGLPIVKRIVEDHAGTIDLSPREDGQPGAQVVISLERDISQTINEDAAE